MFHIFWLAGKLQQDLGLESLAVLAENCILQFQVA